jgi:hypothetical protein
MTLYSIHQFSYEGNEIALPEPMGIERIHKYLTSLPTDVGGLV